MQYSVGYIVIIGLVTVHLSSFLTVSSSVLGRKVEILRHSKQNLTTLFERQKKNCCPNGIIVEKLSFAIIYYVALALGSEQCKLKVTISRHTKPNLTTDVKLLEAGYCKFLLQSIMKINKRTTRKPHMSIIIHWEIDGFAHRAINFDLEP